MLDKINEYLNLLGDLAVTYAPRLILAIVTLLVGLRVIRLLVKVITRQFESTGLDETLRPFLLSLITWTLKVVLFISVASMIGIETTSFLAILGTIGFAIGLALQGSLANFAGGVLIMVLKPYKVKHLVQINEHWGYVTSIQVFNTFLTTFDNRQIILSNGEVMKSEIINYSALGKIRLDLAMGISYGSDIQKARQVLMDVMTNHPKVLKEPAPMVGLMELADSSVNLTVRPWCDPDDYWVVYFEILEGGKVALDQNGIQIPFPQIDVHMKS